MNREIKFRAWCKKDGTMLDWLTMSQTAFNRDDRYSLLYNILVNHKDYYEVMQFTGLLDKNSKEIYEGDIIQFAEKYFYLVKFEDGKFVGYHANNDWGKWGDLYKLGEPGFDKYNYVVIGNIYQNPELLKNPSLPKE